MTAPSDDSENIADPEEIRGMNALLGMELVEWRDGYARTEIEVGAKHLNHGGLVHGGLSLALLDVTSVYPGYWAPRDQERARCVTLSLPTNFIGKAPTEGRLVCEAWRDGGVSMDSVGKTAGVVDVHDRSAVVKAFQQAGKTEVAQAVVFGGG